MAANAECIHATCVVLGGNAALIRGPSGSGKSDLALRFLGVPIPALEAEPRLVSDDQVLLSVRDGRLHAAPPPALAGLIEVRGLGIVKMPHVPGAIVTLVVDLVALAAVPRLPDPAPMASILGIRLPLLRLAPFESSAAIKLALALRPPRS